MASPPSTTFDPQVIASIVAAVTALVAVAVAPFVTIRASKTQMLGPMRQAWINSLRDTVAEYIARIDVGVPQSSAVLAPDDGLRHAAVMERLEHQQQVCQLKSKIALPSRKNSGQDTTFTSALAPRFSSSSGRTAV